MDGTPRGARTEGGFTLIEALAAFTILALVLAAVHGALSTGLGGAARAEQTVFATEAARSLLAQVGIVEPLRGGQQVYPLGDGWEGRVTAELVRAPTASGTAAWAVSVEVAERPRGPALARFDTIRLNGVVAELTP
jgi:type II secretory pathway pseudopilin PulG